MSTGDLFLFVSHVSEDRSSALEIVRELEQRGIRCWIAPRDVRPGKPFDDEIADAIEGSRAMLLIFSDRCNDSEYIRREVTVAGESQKPIIPFRIENAQPKRGLRVRLSDLHWIDGFISRGRAIDDVLRSLDVHEKVLERATGPAPAADVQNRKTEELPRTPQYAQPEFKKAIEKRTKQPQPDGELQGAPPQVLRGYWKLFLIEGIMLVVLGFLAIVILPLAAIRVTILIGWLLLFSGAVGLITTFGTRPVPGFWWSLLSAILTMAAGILLLGSPVSGAISLTFLLIAFFIIEGVLSIMYALEHKREVTGRWGWMLASGIIDLILAAIIFAGLPGSAAWALGLLVGINMLFGGIAMIAMATHARSGDTGVPSRA